MTEKEDEFGCLETVAGLLVAGLLVMGGFWYLTPSEQEKQEKQEKQEALYIERFETFRKALSTTSFEEFITSVRPDGPYLTIGINREMADHWQSDPLDAKQATLSFLNAWRSMILSVGGEYGAHTIVRVEFKWGDVPIASGKYSSWSGNEVILH